MTIPSASSQPIMRAAAGMLSANRNAIAAFKEKVLVVPASSVSRMIMPSRMACRTQPVTRVASAISAGVAAPGLVLAIAASHRWNCETVKFPAIQISIGSVCTPMVTAAAGLRKHLAAAPFNQPQTPTEDAV